MSDLPERTQIVELFDAFLPLSSEKKEAVWEAFRQFDRERTFQILRDLLAPESEYRFHAAHAVMRIDARRGSELVIPLLGDPDAALRYTAAGLLSQFGDERAVAPLIQVLQNDPDGTVRHVVAFALGEIGSPAALPALQRAAREDKSVDYEGRTVGAMAAEAIENIRARPERGCLE